MFSDKGHYRFGGHAYLRSETSQKMSQSDWEQSTHAKQKGLSFRMKQYFASLWM